MSANAIRDRFDLTKPHHFLALGFGSGLMRPAPGTWGTLASVPLFLIMSGLSVSVYIAITLFICVIGVKICGKCAEDIGVHDHPAIVWDEFAGFLITMIMVPPTVFNVVLGFALFRFFDIVKPWPIGYLDRKLRGGLGIMLDDIVAGLFSLLALHLVLSFL
jgi:phosphatidylglycerophosphatase A